MIIKSNVVRNYESNKHETTHKKEIVQQQTLDKVANYYKRKFNQSASSTRQKKFN